MNNKTLAVKISIQTLSDAIAALVYRHILISPASYERFGDKNRITPGLRKMWLAPAGKGRSLDLIAQDIKAYEQFSFLEEDQIIEAIVDFTESHDSAKSMESYLKERIADQKTEKAAIDRKLTRVPVDSEDIQCYVDHALAILPKPELQKEAQDFIKSPNAYFGPLLEVERCKEDLFDLPENQQVKVVESILIATQNRPAYPRRTNSRKAKVTGIKKAQAAKAAHRVPNPKLAVNKDGQYVVLTPVINTMATKKKAPAKKRTVPKSTPKTGGRKADVRTIRSPKVKANNKKFGQIQNAVLAEYYNAGRTGKPKPAAKAVYKKVARKLLA